MQGDRIVIYKKLGELTKIRTGKLDANASSENGEYPFFTCSKTPLAISYYTYDCECVLVAGNGDLNVKYYNGKFEAYQRTYIIESVDKSKLDVKYLYYFLSVYVEKLRLNSTGGVIKFIKLGNLMNAIISLPNIQTQKDIASKLDEQNAILSIKTKQLATLDELIKSHFIEMFGDPVENSLKWKKEPLSKIIINVNNGLTRRGHDANGNIVLRLVELQDGVIDYSNVNRIILSEKEKLKFELKNNDFLFARVNGNPQYVGRCAVFHCIDEKVYHNDHIIRVHFDESIINGTFAMVLLNSHYGKSQMRQFISTSAGQYTINQDGIRAIIAILPPLELQNKFAEFVQKVDKAKTIVKKQITDLQELLDSKMSEYFG